LAERGGKTLVYIKNTFNNNMLPVRRRLASKAAANPAAGRADLATTLLRRRAAEKFL
jgi:hypothetical protein